MAPNWELINNVALGTLALTLAAFAALTAEPTDWLYLHGQVDRDLDREETSYLAGATFIYAPNSFAKLYYDSAAGKDEEGPSWRR